MKRLEDDPEDDDETATPPTPHAFKRPTDILTNVSLALCLLDLVYNMNLFDILFTNQKIELAAANSLTTERKKCKEIVNGLTS